jgi:hypothetical protein
MTLYPVSGCLLSEAALDGVVPQLARKLLVAAASSGLPSTHFIRKVAHHGAGEDQALKVDFIPIRLISFGISKISVNLS